MDLAKHLPAMDEGLRATLEAMTDPDPDKRPQRARDVVALLAKSRPAPSPSASSRALVATGKQALAPRRMFSDIGEPVGTLLRLGVLGFGAGGWLAMMGVRFSLLVVITLASMFAFPARQKVRGVGKELDSMLSEGQSGFTDLMRGAMARRG
jgi:hypothetical protein